MKKNMTRSVGSRKGFTFLEILLVAGIISVLAGIVFLAINPAKQLGDVRNAQRRADVVTIFNAIYQYSIDNGGSLPASTTLVTDICGLGNDKEIGNGTGGLNLVDLYSSLVTSSSTYLMAIPHDPQATSSAPSDGSGYAVVKTSGGRVIVCAPLAENDTISATR